MNSKKGKQEFYLAMLYKNKKIWAIGLLIVAIYACKSVLYVPSSDNVAKNADVAKLQKGREVYIGKCASCHALFPAEKYNKAEWTKWVNKMAPMAKITTEEKELIQAYLTKGE